jgi:hypothetical protein
MLKSRYSANRCFAFVLNALKFPSSPVINLAVNTVVAKT